MMLTMLYIDEDDDSGRYAAKSFFYQGRAKARIRSIRMALNALDGEINEILKKMG